MIANTLSKTVRTMLRNRSKSSSRMRSKSSSRMLRQTVPSKLIAGSLAAAAVAVVFSADGADARTRLEVRLRGASDQVEPQGAKGAIGKSSTMAAAPAPRGARRPYNILKYHHAHPQPSGVVTGNYEQGQNGELVEDANRQSIGEESNNDMAVTEEEQDAATKQRNAEIAIQGESMAYQMDAAMHQAVQKDVNQHQQEYRKTKRHITLAKMRLDQLKHQKQNLLAKEHEQETKKKRLANDIKNEKEQLEACDDDDAESERLQKNIDVHEGQLARAKAKDEKLHKQEEDVDKDIQVLRAQMRGLKQHAREEKHAIHEDHVNQRIIEADAMKHRENVRLIAEAPQMRALAAEAIAKAEAGERLAAEAAEAAEEAAAAKAELEASKQRFRGRGGMLRRGNRRAPAIQQKVEDGQTQKPASEITSESIGQVHREAELNRYGQVVSDAHSGLRAGCPDRRLRGAYR